jgi:hypothetical protein
LSIGKFLSSGSTNHGNGSYIFHCSYFFYWCKVQQNELVSIEIEQNAIDLNQFYEGVICFLTRLMFPGETKVGNNHVLGHTRYNIRVSISEFDVFSSAVAVSGFTLACKTI